MKQENKHPLTERKWGVIPITAYKGVLVTKVAGGYCVLNQKVNTEEQVDEVIAKAGEALRKSIKK